ncbi:MAG: isochorismatase family protein [Syntrophales bacterium]
MIHWSASEALYDIGYRIFSDFSLTCYVSDHIASVKTLVVCGAMSHMCIDATVRAAADAGFNCLVAYDACATRDLSFLSHIVVTLEVHAAFMVALSGLDAQVLSSSAIMVKIK